MSAGYVLLCDSSQVSSVGHNEAKDVAILVYTLVKICCQSTHRLVYRHFEYILCIRETHKGSPCVVHVYNLSK